MCLRFLSEKLIYLAGHPFDFGKGEGTGVGWSSSETVSFLSTGGGLESGISLPARMHKFSTVAPKPSGVLHRLRDPQAGAPARRGTPSGQVFGASL